MSFYFLNIQSPNKLGSRLTKLATELSISRIQLLREVFLAYMMQIKTEEKELI